MQATSSSSAAALEPADVVHRYFDLMDAVVARGDAQAAQERDDLVSTEIVYQNNPLRTIRGKQEYHEFAGSFAGCEFMRGTVTHLAQDGEYVLMERDEEWRVNAVTVAGKIMGIMRVVNGQIVEWSDYQARFADWRTSGQMPEEFWSRWEEPGNAG